MSAAPDAAVVRVVVDTRAIVALFARERPAVQAGEWDEQGYAQQRAGLWREALQTPLADRGARLEVRTDVAGAMLDKPTGCMLCVGGDRVDVLAPAADVQGLLHWVATAARAVAADTGGWRRFLQPAWFERHRAWRREVGSPIQH